MPRYRGREGGIPSPYREIAWIVTGVLLALGTGAAMMALYAAYGGYGPIGLVIGVAAIATLFAVTKRRPESS